MHSRADTFRFGAIAGVEGVDVDTVRTPLGFKYHHRYEVNQKDHHCVV